jgi:hypothetical protein
VQFQAYQAAGMCVGSGSSCDGYVACGVGLSSDVRSLIASCCMRKLVGYASLASAHVCNVWVLLNMHMAAAPDIYIANTVAVRIEADSYICTADLVVQ